MTGGGFHLPVSAGSLGAYRRADMLHYLPPAEQLSKLNTLLAEQTLVARRAKIAAILIKAHIDAGLRDLTTLRKDLQLALAPQQLDAQVATLQASRDRWDRQPSI